MKHAIERGQYWRGMTQLYVGAVLAVILSFFGILHLYDNNYPMVWPLLAGIPFIILTIVGSRATPAPRWVIYPTAYYLLFLVGYMLSLNQYQSAALMWVMAGPPLAMLGLGTRGGIVLTLLLLLVMIFGLKFNDHLLSDHYILRLIAAYALTSAVCFSYEKNRENANRELDEARLRIMVLEGVVPLCSWCSRQVRGSDNQWQSLESYINDKLDVEVTHSICETCAQEQKA